MYLNWALLEALPPKQAVYQAHGHNHTQKGQRIQTHNEARMNYMHTVRAVNVHDYLRKDNFVKDSFYLNSSSMQETALLIIDIRGNIRHNY